MPAALEQDSHPEEDRANGERSSTTAERRIDQLAWHAARALAAAALVVMAWRMLQGFGFSDESFYVAIPLDFALGDQPFVDERNVSQTAAILLYPFIKLYYSIAGTTGIFLFVRVLYLAFFAGVGWTAYALARPHLPRPASLVIATVCITFLPYGLPGLSYNTISMGLFSMGLFWAARWMLTPASATASAKALRSFWHAPIYWAGLAHAAACLAYPSLLLTILAAAGCFTAVARGRRLSALLLYAAGGGTFLLVISPVFALAGMHQIRAMFAYTGGSSLANSFGLAALAERFEVFLVHHPELLPAALITVIGLVAARRWPRQAALALAVAVPIYLHRMILIGNLASLGYVSSLALLGPLFCAGLALRPRAAASSGEPRLAAVLGVAVIAPSLLHGVVMASSSGNGSLATGVGMFPAAIASALALATLVDRAFTAHRGGAAALAPALAPALLLASMLFFATSEASFYGDGPRAALTARIDEGPFWGLYTTPERKAFLGELSKDLLAHRGPAGRRIYCNAPVGYIIAERRPLVSSAWIFPSPAKSNVDAQFFLERARPGDLVLTLDAELNHQLAEIIPATTELVARPEHYTIRQFRGFGATPGGGPLGTSAKTNTIPVAPPIAIPPPAPLDTWLPVQDEQNRDFFSFGWSWPEDWGRWSDAFYAGLVLPTPIAAAGEAPRDLLIKLEMLPHTRRRVRRQRVIVSLGGEVLARDVISTEDKLLEVLVPVRLQARGVLFLQLELPDAHDAEDLRLLGVGLERVMLSRPPSA